MTLVIDSSVVVAALVDSGQAGTWADHLLATDDLAAPHLMPAEVANVLRRAAAAGEISRKVSACSCPRSPVPCEPGPRAPAGAGRCCAHPARPSGFTDEEYARLTW